MIKLCKWVMTGMLSFFLLPVAFASTTPTAAQLQMFQSLPADQQQALADQYGISLPGLSKNSSTPEQEDPQIINPRPDSKALQDGDIQEDNEEDESLPRFGVELFAGSPSTFAPTSDAPVPGDYRIGPGDEIVVQLFGKDNETHRLAVNRNGEINFPSLGPIQVNGLSFSDVRHSLRQRVQEQMIGVSADVTLGKLRSMQIFVMGDAYKPGAYTVSALTTISQAIYYSGGFSESGALRNIQLKRNGKIVRRLDLYDLLLHGDARNDVRLMPNDVVLIGAVGKTLRIDGEINRPAIYELAPKQSFASVIDMAGGFTANALRRRVEVQRYTAQGKNVLTLDFNKDQDAIMHAKQGDSLYIQQKSEALYQYVELKGDVKHPGYVQWRPDLHIADLFSSLEYAFKATADINYAIVVREVNAQRDIEVLQVNLANAILAPNSVDNLQLHSRDQLIVFNRFNNALLDLKQQEEDQDALSLEQAKQKAFDEELTQKVQMNAQTSETLQQDQNETQSSKLMQSQDDVEVDKEQAAKEQLRRDNTRQSLLAPVLLQLQQQSRLGLAPQIVEVTGEVVHPGRYPLADNMHVSQVLSAAGGLTYQAYSISGELTHTAVNNEERASLQITKVNLRKAILGNNSADLVISALDKLSIFEKPNMSRKDIITIQGEVRFPGTYVVRQGETLGDVLQRAGGVTKYAHLQGAIFTREALRVQEQNLLDQYAADLRRSMVKKSFRVDSNVSSMMSNPEETLKFVEQASHSKALGRMVIQLDQISNGNKAVDFIVEDDDFLFVPKFRNTVSVMGEVQVPVTYLLDNNLDMDDYLKKAGGAKKQADIDRTYVVRADGSVYKPDSGWFAFTGYDVKPGDTIIVPLDTNYRDSLSLWQAVTQILYQSGVAINALDLN